MSDDGALEITGLVIGAIAGLITFVCVYIAAVSSVGWVIGIALGWFPALLAGLLAFWLGRYLWWLAALLLLALIVSMMR
jgi:hypothetical protein